MRAINLRIPHAKRVLDFGCGTGWVLAEAEFEGPNAIRFGVDIAHDDLRRGREAQPDFNAAVADGLHLPFAAESFDVVVGHVSMPYMNTAGALAEIHRVLASGGSLFLTFHNFRYARERLFYSLKRGNGKDVAYTLYMMTNAVLNHWALPQMQCPWKRSRFETVNTPAGVCRIAAAQGFILASAEGSANRIFFAFTARKPDPSTGSVLPEPAWSAYCHLRGSR